MRLAFSLWLALLPHAATAQGHMLCATYAEEQSMLAPCPDCRITTALNNLGTVKVTSTAGWTAELKDLAPGLTGGAGTGRWASASGDDMAGKTFDLELGTDGRDWLMVTMVPHDPDMRYTINLGYRCLD